MQEFVHDDFPLLRDRQTFLYENHQLIAARQSELAVEGDIGGFGQGVDERADFYVGGHRGIQRGVDAEDED